MTRFWRWSLAEQQQSLTPNCTYPYSAILDDPSLCSANGSGTIMATDGSKQVANLTLVDMKTITNGDYKLLFRPTGQTIVPKMSPSTLFPLNTTSSEVKLTSVLTHRGATIDVDSSKKNSTFLDATSIVQSSVVSSKTDYVLDTRTYSLTFTNNSEASAQVLLRPLNRTVTVTFHVSVFEVHNSTDRSEESDDGLEPVVTVDISMPERDPLPAPLTTSGKSDSVRGSLMSSSSEASPHSRPYIGPHAFNQGLTALNRHPFNYLINVPDLCNGSSGLTLVILVTTAVNHFEHRQAIRETWGGYAKSQSDVRLGFIMGRPESLSEEQTVVREAMKHGDIIQEDFSDTYKNLTLKTVMLLKWAHTLCPVARFVMKSDDDMFINVPNLLKYIRSLKNDRRQLFGRLVKSARPLRSRSSKYYVPVTEYRDNVYPDYLSGTAYVMSSDVTQKLFETSQVTPIFFFEDVYITGICAKKAGIVRRNHPGFVYYKRPVKGCSYVRVISGHNNTPKDLRKIWRDLSKKNLKCV